VLPAIWEQQTFIDRAGPEILGQMYTFGDKKGRPACLIPEVTGLVQDRWREAWAKTKARPYRMFYESRCYRYERPQKGRYREFTQVGIEILGDDPEATLAEAKQTLVGLLDELGLEYRFKDSVRRGLTYYTSPGFEVECDGLGAQKPIFSMTRTDAGLRGQPHGRAAETRRGHRTPTRPIDGSTRA
jgi:histidyl-tRNA synthetase